MKHSLDGGSKISRRPGAGCDSSEALSSAETILYVEDEAFVREVTAEVLRAAGYHVLVANSGASASEIFQAWGPDVDLLLTDVILPGETGRVLASGLRRANPELKVLYVTGYAEQMGVGSTASEDCLAKPFSTDALLERVKRMIDRTEFSPSKETKARLACA